MKTKIFRGIGLFLVLAVAAIAAAAWYDEGPDEALQRQWDGRARVEDKDNLFLAMIAVDRDSTEPLHATGRRLFDNPASEVPARLRSSDKDVREFLEGVRTECLAIPSGAAVSCLYRHLPSQHVGNAEKRLSEQYLALRRYPAYRSEIRDDDIVPAAGGILNAQAVHIAVRMAVERAEDLAVEDLVADTAFQREVLGSVDSLLAHVMSNVMVERNYRLIAEALEAGTAAQAAALKPVLQPLPEKALDLGRDLAFQHMSNRIQYASYRKALAADKDPMEEYSKLVGQPSPFAEPGLPRRFKSLFLKPGMTSNALLAETRASLGIPSTHEPPGAMDSILNATGAGLDSGGGWKTYQAVMSDLDRFVRLVSVVGALSGGETFDPAQVVSEWNSKPGAQPYRLDWDEKRSAFAFDPQSARWRDRAKKAGHGVLVRMPPRVARLRVEKPAT